MGYPFVQFPTFREFRERLENEYNCSFESLERTINNGEIITIFFFVRIIGDRQLRCSIQNFNDDDRIKPSVLRSICERLEIDPIVFGFTLG